MDTENVQEQEEVVVQEENTTTEEVEDSQDDSIVLTKSEFKKLQRKAIAYDATKSKETKEVVKETPTITSSLTAEDVEFKILKSKGINEDLLNQMRDLAKLRGKSILEVENDPIIVALKEAKEAEEKAKKASLPASRGSSPVKKEKGFTTTGLTDEEHKALWKERFNK